MTDAPVLQSLIGDGWRAGSGPELVSTDPARPDDVVAAGRAALVTDVDDAVTAAVHASRAWASAPHHERAAVLAGAASIVRRNADEWGHELTREEGKLLAEGIGEVRRAAQILNFYAAEADRAVGEVFASPRSGESIQVSRRPLGVVGVITPFNFPIAIPAWKIAPALSYGNTVVWKPADTVPLLGQRLAEALVDAGLPPGVVQLLHGGADVGRAIADHPDVDAVTFTGSTAVGRDLIARCAGRGAAVQAEMGGNNAAIVLPDADLGAAVADVVAGAFRAAGQRCTATSRVVVHDAVADDVIGRVVTATRAMVVGDPLENGVDIGPLVTAAARDRVLAALDAAACETDVLVPMDRPRRSGHFVTPAVLALSDTTPAVWSEEVFGPTLAVIRARSSEHAVDLAADSEYGLTCSLFTNDLRAVRMAEDRVRTGILHVNSETGGADPHVPFGGTGASGYGPKEQGRAAREFFTYPHTTYLRAAGHPG